MTEIKLVDHQAVYAGQRSAKGGRLAHAWVIDGQEAWFTKPIGYVVGGIYVLSMSEDLKKASARGARYTTERIADQALIAEWEILHQTTQRKRKREAAERKHRANDILKDATWSLDNLVRGLKNVDEVYALNTLLQEHLLDTYWKSRK